MNTSLKSLVLVAVSLNLTACFQISAPICDSSNLADLPGLEGTYEMRTFDSQKFETQKQSFAIQHEGRGAYSTPSGRMDVCLVNGKYLVQGRSEKGYSVQWARLSGDLSSLSLTSLAADVNTLSQNGVPFQIVESKDLLASMGLESKELTQHAQGLGQKALLIDNSRVSASQFVSLLDAVSLDITLWRVK